MKYLQKYDLFESTKEEKALEKIKKFCKDDFIVNKAVELSPKLAVWIVNQFIKEFTRIFTSPDTTTNFNQAELDDYFKKGINNIEIKQRVFAQWNNTYSNKFQSVIDWSLSNDISVEDRDDLTKMSLKEAYEKAEEWHNSLIAGGEITDEHGKVIMTFPDGFYWIDLETTNDRAEADAMGHCGRTTKGDTIISLRDRKKSPHVTAAVGIKDDDKAIIYQMKGRNNNKPIEKYHKYIVDLLMNDDIVIDGTECTIQGFGNEYDKEEDFSPNDLEDDLKNALLKKRPNINDSVFSDQEIDEMFERMIDSNYLQEDEYGFGLISWIKSLFGFDKVVECLITRNGKLFDILCEVYPDKVKFDAENFTDDQKEKSEIMIDIASSHIDSDMVEKKYNLDLKKSSEFDRWKEIFKFIGFEGMEEVLKTHGIAWDKYIEETSVKFGIEKLREDFTTTRNSYGSRWTIYDYGDILDYFIPGGPEKQYEVLETLFDGNNRWNDKEEGEYYKDIWNVFESCDCSSAIENKFTREEKENEMENNSWYEYTEDY